MGASRFPIDGPDIESETDSEFDGRSETRTEEVTFPMARPEDFHPPGQSIREEHAWSHPHSIMWTLSTADPSDTTVIVEEDKHEFPRTTERARLPIPGPPRYYSTPLDSNDPDTTPVRLYGLEEPKDFMHRRKPLVVRPKSALHYELRPSTATGRLGTVGGRSASRQPSPLASSFGPAHPSTADTRHLSRMYPLEPRHSSLIRDRYSIAQSSSSSTSSGSSASRSASETSTAATVRTRATTPADSTTSPSPKMSAPYLTSASEPDLSLTLMSDMNEAVPPLPRDPIVRPTPLATSVALPAPRKHEERHPAALQPVETTTTVTSNTSARSRSRSRPRRDPSRRNSVFGLSFPSFGSSISSISSIGSTRSRSDSTDTTETVRPPRSNTIPTGIHPPSIPPSQPAPSHEAVHHEPSPPQPWYPPSSYYPNPPVPRGSGILAGKSHDARPASSSSQPKRVLMKKVSRLPDEKASKRSRRFSIWR